MTKPENLRETWAQEFPAIDIIKFLCAILVVAIHIPPLSSFSDNVYADHLNYGICQYLARIAVPFYFAAAGFLFFRKLDIHNFNAGIFKKYIFKNLRLLGLWTVLLFDGSTGHLWYIGGVIVGVFLLGVLLYYRVPLKGMMILGAVLYLVGLLGDSYYGLLAPLQSHKLLGYVITVYEGIFSSTRNGVFMGFPFILLGGVIQIYKVNIKPSTAFLGFVISMLALFGETFALRALNIPKDHNMYVFLFPVEFFLLSFAANVRMDEREIYKKLRNVGIMVYFSHLFVDLWVCRGFRVVEILFDIAPINSLVEFALTVLAAIALGFLLERLSRIEKLSFIRYLYS